MTLQLPQHLQGRTSHNIAEKAAVGLGSVLPPHISIRGNTFTLVDAGGNEAAFGPTLDIVIVDSSEQPQKRYYDQKWTPQSNDPPLCFSTNGIVPSREAVQQQARTCAECKWNERGSAISAISGAAIKACRDEKWLAVLLPTYPTMLFQLVITPGSFKNWQAYTKNFGNGVDISDVITRVTFQAQVNGVLVFEILGYGQNNPQFISNDVLKVLETAWAEKKTDVLVGRSDVPIMLAAPQATVQISQGPVAPIGTVQVPFVPAPAPAAALQNPTAVSFALPAATAPVDPQPQRRRRRTAAEMQAAQAPQGQHVTTGIPPLQAPFAPQAQPTAIAPGQPGGGPAFTASTPAGNGANFGMQAGTVPNPDLAKTLEGLFGRKK